jgi:hypothetical protein
MQRIRDILLYLDRSAAKTFLISANQLLVFSHHTFPTTATTTFGNYVRQNFPNAAIQLCCSQLPKLSNSGHPIFYGLPSTHFLKTAVQLLLSRPHISGCQPIVFTPIQLLLSGPRIFGRKPMF